MNLDSGPSTLTLRLLAQLSLLLLSLLAPLQPVSATPPLDTPELNLLSIIPGNYLACAAIQGDYAFVGDLGGRKIIVADISVPASPVVISSVTVPTPYQIVIKNNLAFIAGRENGITILDITDPFNPTILSRYDTLEFSCKVDISDNVLFTTNRQAGLEIVDITDPSNPQFLCKLDFEGEWQGVILQENFLYVTQWGDSRVIVFDVSDPVFPIELTRVPLSAYGQGLDVRGNLLCAATGEGGPTGINGMDIYDISIPSSPVHLSTVELYPYSVPFDIWSVVISGNYAFVTDGNYGAYVIDISDPANPVVMAHATTQGQAINLAVDDGRFYVCDIGSGVRIFDATGYATTPTERVTYPLPINTPPAPAPPPGFNLHSDGGSYHSIAATSTGKVLAAAGDGGLHIFELQAELTKINTYTPPNHAFALDVSVSGENILLAESNGLTILGLDEFNQFSVKDTYYDRGFKVQALSDQWAILATDVQNIHVLDISNPNNILLSYKISMPNVILQICPTIFNGHYACIVYATGFAVIDLENPVSPIQYNYTIDWATHGGAIYVDPNNVIGYYENQGKILMYDMATTPPTLLSTLSLIDFNVSFGGTLTIQDSKLILNSWLDGDFAIFDISNPLNPVFTEAFSTDFNSGPALLHELADFVPDGRGGLLYNANIFPIGIPSYTPAIDAGYYVWQDSDDGEWHLRWSGDSIHTYYYNGSVSSDLEISNVTPYSFEANDALSIALNGFSFSGYAGAGEDGIDFFAPEGAQLSFDLLADNAQSPDMIHIGASGINPPQVPFDIESLATNPTLPADVPTEDLLFAGEPDYIPAQELGFFLWQDSFTDAWHLRWSGDSINTYHFTGTITSDASFTASTTYSFESNDSMRADSTMISFSGYAGAGEDGIDFSVPQGSLIAFDLKIDGQSVPNLIYIGPQRTSPSQSPFSINTTATQIVPVEDIIFTSPPTYTPAVDAGYYLWQDKYEGAWHLRWSGDSIKTKYYYGKITVNSSFTSAISYNFEPDDALQADATTVTFSGYAGAGEDGIDFVIPQGSEVYFDLHVDGIQDPLMIHIGPNNSSPNQLPFALKMVESIESIATIGIPTYVPAQDAGYYLWQDADDGEWHLRWSGDSITTFFYNGSLMCNAGFISLTPFSYEISDTLQIGRTVIEFGGFAGAGEDGLDFFTPPGSVVSFDILVFGAPDSTMIHIGETGSTPTQVPYAIQSSQ